MVNGYQLTKVNNLTLKRKHDNVYLLYILTKGMVMKVMKLFKKVPKQNMAELRGELSRAHMIIALLSLIAIVLLVLRSTVTSEFDPTLSNLASAFLAFLVLVSLGVSYALFKYKR